MSTAGQALGGLIGGVVGFFNPVLGWQVGAQLGIWLGGLLDPPKGPTVTGPRLGDLTIQTATYGAVIPRVYGTVPIVGNLFWLENNAIRETVVKKKSGGKGGSKTKTKTYVNYATFAVGLCKGPITGVKRIWIKGELFYDAGSSDPSTVAASNAAATGFTVHLGTDTQMPDTRIQATIGAADTPAWRGLAYIVFLDLPLAKYGESLVGAQVKVEVVRTGTEQHYSATYGALPARDWTETLWTGGEFLVFERFASHVARSSDGVTWSESILPFSGASIFDSVKTSKSHILLSQANLYRSTNNWVTSTTIPVPGGYAATAIGYDGSKLLMAGTAGFASLRLWISEDDGVTWVDHLSPDLTWSSSFGVVLHNGTRWIIINNGTRLYTSETGLSGSWTLRQTLAFSNWNWGSAMPTGQVVLISSGSAGNYSSPDGITWTWNPSVPAGFPIASGYGSTLVANDGSVFVACGSSGYYWSSDYGTTWSQVLDVGNFSSGSLVWTGSVFFQPSAASWGRWRTIKPYTIASTSPTLGDVASEECLQSGILQSGDINTAALTSIVRGYTVGSVGSIRGALTQLAASWPFDVVQSGYDVTFVPRGGASVQTIPQEDLDARGEGTEAGIQVTASREMDTQLPRRMVIKYLDYDREFDVGEQYAERLNTDSVHEETQEIAIVLTGAEAAGKAEVLLFMRWLERYDLAFNLPQSYNHLEPADVVTLETPEGNVILRLTAINYTSDSRLECRAKYADQAVYTPAALGVAPVVTGPTTIASSGASSYVLLDVPYLHPAQADPGFLAAMFGVSAGWPGGVLIRTDDSGTTWNDLQAFDTPGSDVGIGTNTIGSVDSRVWDKASSLSVTMLNGSLSSVTELAVLNGENYFAYGDAGRWEIIGVQNCTLVSGKTYTLYDMLRGRAGTEWAMSTHQIGDKLVSLSLTDVTAIGMASASIGLTREYRGITYGRDIDTDVDLPFAYVGVNLECLSPVYFRGYKTVASSDWNLEWVRRSRTDGEWRDLVDAGLSETSEAYEVDIFTDGTFATVKRTIAAATQSCTYTSAQQVTDFGSNQATIYAKAYQLSSVVGRGYPETATIS
jgi:hypothetical protein